MERKQVVVAFGDILGFGGWTKRAANSPETSEPFIYKFYEKMQEFAIKEKNVHFKYLGDGLMVLKELSGGSNSHVCASRFISEVIKLNQKLRGVVHECAWPQPDGFRTRIVAGHVWKIMAKNMTPTENVHPEYVGYVINLAQRLLEVSPYEGIIIHESAVKVLGRAKKGYKFRKVDIPKEQPRGVDSEDLSELWTV